MLFIVGGQRGWGWRWENWFWRERDEVFEIDAYGDVYVRVINNVVPVIMLSV